jgi:exopolysaccharide biosynthesis polyprenyl glycosylphosphotransferase
MVFDLLIMVMSFALAAWVSYFQIGTISLEEFIALRIKVQNFVIFHIFLLFWHLIFSFCRVYQPSRLSLRSPPSVVRRVLIGTTVGSLMILIMGMLCKIEIITPSFMIIFWIFNSSMAIVLRLIIRGVLKGVRAHSSHVRHLLIVGTNSRAIKFAQSIEVNEWLDHRVVGFADEKWGGIEEFCQTDFHLVTDLDSFEEYIREHVVDEVVISLPMKTYYKEASKIVFLCEEQGILVRFLSSIFSLQGNRFRSEHFQVDSAIMVNKVAMQGVSALMKRMMDILFSTILLILLLPVFLGTMLLIKLTSSGPVIYVQERVGLNKRRFRLYKFRTMIEDADRKLAQLEHLNEVSGPVFKIRDDPRITPIGGILRKTSIDELPQLINVLKGDMSLVGPRPLPVRDYQGFEQDWHRRRFAVRPGLTCLWQVSGRSDIPFEKWMELDMQYIDKWSLWLDLRILVKTFLAVSRGFGAV